MADRLDAAQALEFLLGPAAILGGRLQIAVDELDGLEQAAGGLGFPDFAEAAAAKPFDQLVAGNGLGSWFNSHAHDDSFQFVLILATLISVTWQRIMPRQSGRTIKHALGDNGTVAFSGRVANRRG